MTQLLEGLELHAVFIIARFADLFLVFSTKTQKRLFSLRIFASFMGCTHMTRSSQDVPPVDNEHNGLPKCIYNESRFSCQLGFKGSTLKIFGCATFGKSWEVLLACMN